MARAHRLSTTFERVGFENAFCAVHWATSPRNLKRIDRAVPKHDVGSQREHVLNSLDHGATKSIRPCRPSLAARAQSSTLTNGQCTLLDGNAHSGCGNAGRLR